MKFLLGIRQAPASAIIENFPDFARETLTSERFLKESNAWIEDSMMDYRVIRVSGNVEHFDGRSNGFKT